MINRTLLVLAIVFAGLCGWFIGREVVTGQSQPSQLQPPTDHLNDVVYIASAGREPFHHAACRSASRIVAANRMHFTSRQTALDAGHRPCKKCKP